MTYETLGRLRQVSRDPMPAQQLIEGLCSLLGEENSRPRQFDRGLRSWDRFGEPVRPFDRKVDIVRTPDDQCRSLQSAQLRFDRQSVLVIERANETLQVSRTLLAARCGRK